MRDPGALDPDIRAQLEAENAYTLGIMADTEELQQQLFAEMKARIKEDDSSVPAPDGAILLLHALRHRRSASLCSAALPRAGGDEQLLIDGNALAKDHAYFRICQCRAQPRPQAHRLCGRYQGLGILHRPSRRGRDRRRHRFPTSPTTMGASNGRPTAGRCSMSGSTTSTARARS